MLAFISFIYLFIHSVKKHIFIEHWNRCWRDTKISPPEHICHSPFCLLEWCFVSSLSRWLFPLKIVERGWAFYIKELVEKVLKTICLTYCRLLSNFSQLRYLSDKPAIFFPPQPNTCIILYRICLGTALSQYVLLFLSLKLSIKLL